MSYLSPNCQALGPQSPTQLQGNGADTKITITVLLVPQTFPMCSVHRVGLHGQTRKLGWFLGKCILEELKVSEPQTQILRRLKYVLQRRIVD